MQVFLLSIFVLPLKPIIQAAALEFNVLKKWFHDQTPPIEADTFFSVGTNAAPCVTATELMHYVSILGQPSMKDSYNLGKASYVGCKYLDIVSGEMQHKYGPMWEYSRYAQPLMLSKHLFN